MASTIRFFGGNGTPEVFPAASGGFNTVGFYGAGFGLSVRVGEYNESTFRTIENGTSNGGSMPNLRFANPTGAWVAGLIPARELLEVDNSEATLRVRLNTDSAVATQNTNFRAFDKNDINNPPSGVTVLAAEIRKDNVLVRGSGDSAWTTIAGSGSVLSLDSRADLTTQKDFYIGLTVSPNSIGEKTQFALYFETEFL